MYTHLKYDTTAIEDPWQKHEFMSGPATALWKIHRVSLVCLCTVYRRSNSYTRLVCNLSCHNPPIAPSLSAPGRVVVCHSGKQDVWVNTTPCITLPEQCKIRKSLCQRLETIEVSRALSDLKSFPTGIFLRQQQRSFVAYHVKAWSILVPSCRYYSWDKWVCRQLA